MSEANPPPGPLTELALELKAQNDRRNAFMLDACKKVGEDPVAAERLLVQALQMNEAFYLAEGRLLEQWPPAAADAAQREQSIRREKASILASQAQAVSLQGRNAEASALYQQVLALLDADHPMRPTVLAAKAEADMQAILDGGA